MVQGGLAAVLKDPGILAVRSSAPVSARQAARIVEGLLCPRAARRWTQDAAEPSASCGPAQLLDVRLALAPGGEGRGAPSQPDVLWILCQLALSARDLGLVLEVELDGLRGSVSTGGLDAGARAMLAAAWPQAEQARGSAHVQAAAAQAVSSPVAAAPLPAAGATARPAKPAAQHEGKLRGAPRTERPRARRLLAHAG